ncbi:DUF5641 domain-containing protein [Trichonephila clavata]|uniref:DUF5641 domain-containing protein n=1 Tax=Trichonephila clavata TaxID=2740835 RepID=A0A8X6GH11_TRICU|nr:DUF5641 domain-containing protein [Trichonephila clavata]
MSLHKWCSNTPEILTSIPKEQQSWDFHCQSSDKTIKTLGVIWNPQFDYFSFKTVVNCQDSYTKREVLSIIARLFDPLGFIGPILTKAKLLLQKLWVLKLEWDEPLSNPIAKEWNDFVSTLPVIQNIHIPRLVLKTGRIILHGFADASTAAYGAVLFIKNCRNPRVKRSGQLHYSEVNEAELWLIKNLQTTAFKEEIDALAKGGCISKKVMYPDDRGFMFLNDGSPPPHSSYSYNTKEALDISIVSPDIYPHCR